MKKKFKRLKSAFYFTANLSTTGALFQTSRKAVLEVCKHIDKSRVQTIVEFGAGHGNITEVMLQKMNPSSKLYVFEINSGFCKDLKKIEDPRLMLVNASAEMLDSYCGEKIDCIISTLPLTFLKDTVISNILSKSKDQLVDQGTFSQILYSTFHLKKFRLIFKEVKFRVIISFPFQFVYHSIK